MSRTVFILGAGASKAAGGPLMAEFLDAADAVSKERDIGTDKEHFELVFKALAELDAVHAKAVLDVRNLESVFGAFEMAAMCGRLGTLSQEDLTGLGRAIRRVIVRTLESRIVFPVINQAVLAPAPYGDFIRLVNKMNEAGMGPVSFISFNYDLGLDYALFRSRQEVDYCFGDEFGGVPVMKLHGSLNWARCGVCRATTPWRLRAYFSKYNWDRALLFPETKTVQMSVGQRVSDLDHCGIPCEPEPVIVPPTWNKAQYQDMVVVWRRAALHLSEAENIIVIGYSLPTTDEFFRYLYALGSVGRARLKRFYVVDPAEGVANQFARLLGPVAKDRFRLS